MITEKNVATPSAIVAVMICRAEVMRTLQGGTAAMRCAKQKYLPKHAAEDDECYKSRVARSVLFNATIKTVEDLTGKVFTKPIVLKENVPAELVKYAEDIDLAGTHINLFACEAFKDGLIPGIGFIFTDAPPPPPESSERVLTKADTNALGIRPYLSYIPLERMLGWKSERIQGVETLTQVRFKECVTEPDGDFHDKEIEQIRVLEIGYWRIFRKDQRGEWAQFADGKTPLLKITLVPFYANRTGFMTGAPPLEKMADLNIAHWQLDSDVSNIMHFANVPMMFGAGFPDDQLIKIGANQMIRTSNPDAKLTVVEHAGTALGKAQERLTELKLQMQAMGLQLLVDKPGQTATGEIRDSIKENSPLAMMARSLQDAIEVSLGFMAEYEGLGADAGGEVEVNTDFGMGGVAGDIQYLTQAVIAGKIDNETYINELIRRKVLGESTDVETVLSRLAAEPPASGSVMPLGAAA